MKCANEECQIDLNFLICEIKGPEITQQYCLNHTLINIEEIVETLRNAKPFSVKCECCDEQDSFEINYGADGKIHLCLNDIIALLELNLSPKKFLILYAKYPQHHILHDDFYDAETGIALQPRVIL